MDYDIQGIALILLGAIVVIFRSRIIQLQMKTLSHDDGLSQAVKAELGKKYMPNLAVFIGLLFILFGLLKVFV